VPARALAAPDGMRRPFRSPPEDVITADNLRQVYGVDVRVTAVDGVRACLPVL